jgi:hypothetical protein
MGTFMNTDSSYSFSTNVDPQRCMECPPERVCAWACQQGWGAHEILIEMSLIDQGVLSPHPNPQVDIDNVRNALWEDYN